MSIRTYSELITLPTFEERFRYLQLSGSVGKETFGFDRYLNQNFYRSAAWKRVRDRMIYGKILIHHMNPISDKDILNLTDILLNPEYLICVDHITHNAIHYGDENLLIKDPVVRFKNDTCPWKR